MNIAMVHWDVLNTGSAPAGNDRVKNLLIGYHRRGITSRKVISQLLLAEPEPIIMRYRHLLASLCIQLIFFPSEGTVARRLKKYGLFASGKTTRLMPETEKRQHVLDQMSLDPMSKQGPRTIKEGLASKVHLTRYVEVPNFPCKLMITFSIEITFTAKWNCTTQKDLTHANLVRKGPAFCPSFSWPSSWMEWGWPRQACCNWIPHLGSEDKWSGNGWESGWFEQ